MEERGADAGTPIYRAALQSDWSTTKNHCGYVTIMNPRMRIPAIRTHYLHRSTTHVCHISLCLSEESSVSAGRAGLLAFRECLVCCCWDVACRMTNSTPLWQWINTQLATCRKYATPKMQAPKSITYSRKICLPSILKTHTIVGHVRMYIGI